MRASVSNFRRALLLTALLTASVASAGSRQTETAPAPRPLDRREHCGYESWERLLPTHVKAQYAGGMGFLSAGYGWDYGRKCRWETDMMIGVLSKAYSDRTHMTFTLKQNYIPWSIRCGERFAAPPDHIGTDPELEGELLGRKAVERPSLRVEGFDVDVVARGVAAEKVYPHVVHLLPVVAAQHRPGRFAPRKQRAVGNERPCGGIAPHRSGKLGIGPQQELHLDGRHVVRSGFGAIGDAGRATAQHQGKENRYGNETFHLIGG